MHCNDQAYAQFYDALFKGLPGDTEFYVDEARRKGGPVLELGCGTGRLVIPTAEAGFEVTGLDLSPNMLGIARKKVEDLPESTRSRIQLVDGDMRDFHLDSKFMLITIPYRVFLALLTPEDQRSCLGCVREHIEQGGRLILNTFDPRLDVIISHMGILGSAMKKMGECVHPVSGNRVIFWDCARHNPENQSIHCDWFFEEIDGSGQSVSRACSSVDLRWTYRSEMQYLLEVCGFEIEALYGDFTRGPYHYGGEQIWIARKAK